MKLKHFTTIVTVFILSISLIGCQEKDDGTQLGPAEMLDNDTGKIVSLGDPKEKFEEMFGTSTDGDTDGDVTYLSGILEVTYSDNEAIKIVCSGDTNRFSFYNFDFSMKIEEIEGRYEKFDASGYSFYSRYYDESGNDVKNREASVQATLMVRIGDLMDMKDGQFLDYTIELN